MGCFLQTVLFLILTKIYIQLFVFKATYNNTLYNVMDINIRRKKTGACLS